MMLSVNSFFCACKRNSFVFWVRMRSFGDAGFSAFTSATAGFTAAGFVSTGFVAAGLTATGFAATVFFTVAGFTVFAVGAGFFAETGFLLSEAVFFDAGAAFFAAGFDTLFFCVAIITLPCAILWRKLYCTYSYNAIF